MKFIDKAEEILSKCPSWGIFLSLFILGLILYYPIAPYMLMDDGISGLWEVKNMNYERILRSDHFKSLYQLHYFFLYLYWNIFGTNTTAYFIWFVALQSAVISLFYFAMPRVMALFKVRNVRLFFLLIAVLLISSPNNFENIAWAATSHYNLGLLFYFIMLIAFVNYILGSRRSLYVFHAVFLLSLFTIEMSLLFPISILMLILLLALVKKDWKQLKSNLLNVGIPMLLFFALSFALLKMLNNAWLPHGAARLNWLPTIEQFVTNTYLYFSQGIAYTNFLSPETREAFYALVQTNFFWPLLLLSLLFIFFALRRKRYALLILFLNAVMFLLPNLFRFGASSSSYENVRFIYFSLPFILSFFLFWFRSKQILYSSFFIVFLLGNMMFINKTKQDKIIAGELHQQYLSEVTRYDSKNVYLLNIPSFCNQFFVYRSIRRVGIDANMKNSKLNADDYNEVMWFYAQSVTDSFSVEKIGVYKIKVVPRSNGVWFMKEHFGATPYETDDYKVEILEWGEYSIEFKNPLPTGSKLLLYSNGKIRNVINILSTKKDSVEVQGVKF